MTYTALRFSLKTDLGGCKVPEFSGGAAPRPPFMLLHFAQKFVLMYVVCPSIDGVLATPLSRGLETSLSSECGKGSSAVVGWTSARGCSFLWPNYRDDGCFLELQDGILPAQGMPEGAWRLFGILFLFLAGLLYPARRCPGLQVRYSNYCPPLHWCFQC